MTLYNDGLTGSGQIVVTKDNTEANYANLQFVSTGDKVAGYAFHIPGIVGGALYMKKGYTGLFFKDSTNTEYIINMTKI